MKKNNFKVQTKECGLSLVEVLASIVILTLLLTTFLMVFIQSAKMNKTSEDLIEATYIAQTAMENIYAISERTNFENNDTKTEMEKIGYTTTDSKNYNNDENMPYIEVKLESKEETKGLVSVIVKVYNNKERERLKAQMETILLWGAVNE